MAASTSKAPRTDTPVVRERMSTLLHTVEIGRPFTVDGLAAALDLSRTTVLLELSRVRRHLFAECGRVLVNLGGPTYCVVAVSEPTPLSSAELRVLMGVE